MYLRRFALFASIGLNVNLIELGDLTESLDLCLDPLLALENKIFLYARYTIFWRLFLLLCV